MIQKKNQKYISFLKLLLIVSVFIYIYFFIKSKLQQVSINSSLNILSLKIDGYYQTCFETFDVYKKEMGKWLKTNSHPPRDISFYLDNKFMGIGMCDLVQCELLPKPFDVELVEYVKVGQRAAPIDFGGMISDVYKTKPLKGDIKIETKYYLDPNCGLSKAYSKRLYIK